MKTWVVRVAAGEGYRLETVRGDRVFVDARLMFIRNKDGERFGTITASFAPGSWTYFTMTEDTE